MMGNKVKYGLKNVYYAVVTEANGVVSYGTPQHIPGAVNLTQNPAGEHSEFYADDELYFEANTNNGYDGNLEMALVPDDFQVDVLGDEIDANGAVIENANAEVKKFALMFEFDGDANKTRYVNYSVLPTRPSVEGSTKTKTKEPKTETMNISVRPAIDTGDVKAKLKPTDTGYDTFFTAVYLKDASTNTVAASTASFSKAAPADLVVDVTSSDATNAVKNVLLDGQPIGGIHLTATGVDVTIAQAYIAALDNATYTITVEFNKGNSVIVMLTVAA